MKKSFLLVILAVLLLTSVSIMPINKVKAVDSKFFGVLQPSVTNIATNKTAGVNTVVVSLSWKKFEPTENVYDQAYINGIKTQINTYTAAGQNVILSTGVHHTPAWIFAYPNSYFVDQFGQRYSTIETGKAVSNMVFNQTLRQKQDEYLQAVFANLGTSFLAVRAGGGWYGELNFPSQNFGTSTNSYWGFDNISKGLASGLPAGISTNPVPNWLPGQTSLNHSYAQSFLEWYLSSQDNYHDWQISALRKYYQGYITMMYPSWGIRPGDVTAAVNVDLNGSSSAERNGEIQRGFDFARFISGITDAKVVPYTTWLNANLGDDLSTNQARWNPVHFIAHYAAHHPLQLKAWGENTGADTNVDMDFTFSQMAKYNLMGIVWAFEPELYNTTGAFASISYFESKIAPYNLPPADTTAPVLTMVSPTNNSTVSINSVITIRSNASDANGISAVKVTVNGVTICTIVGTLTTYSCNWTVPAKRKTSYTIVVRATDPSNNTTQKQVIVKTN